MSTTPASQPEQPGWSLQRGGPIYRQLEAQLYSRSSGINEPIRSIGRQMQDTLELIAAYYRSPGGLLQYPWLGHQNLEGLQLLEALLVHERWSSCDIVLRWTIAHVEDCPQAAATLRNRAMNAYSQAYSTYDLLFGDLVQPLREETAPTVSAANYLDGNNPTALDDWEMFQQELERERQTPSQYGVPTGLPALDAALGSGQRGLTFIGGDRGVGKTTLMLCMLQAALRADPGLAALVYSFDMHKRILYRRMVCNASGLTYRRLVSQGLTGAEQRQLQTANATLQPVLSRFKAHLRNAVPHGQGLTTQMVRQHMQELLEESQASRLIVAIDLFQRIPTPANMAQESERDSYRLDLIRDMRDQAASIIVLSEIRKGESGRRELRHEDLLGSSRMASDADNIFLLWPTAAVGEAAAGENDQSVSPLTLRIDKGRDSVRRTDIQLEFAHEISRFTCRRPSSGSPRVRTRFNAAPSHAPDALTGLRSSNEE